MFCIEIDVSRCFVFVFCILGTSIDVGVIIGIIARIVIFGYYS